MYIMLFFGKIYGMIVTTIVGEVSYFYEEKPQETDHDVANENVMKRLVLSI